MVYDTRSLLLPALVSAVIAQQYQEPAVLRYRSAADRIASLADLRAQAIYQVGNWPCV